jgi:hypothetical protein
MKKRTTKKSRNLLARKKVKKQKRFKLGKNAILNIPKQAGFHKKGAVLSFLLVGISLFSFLNTFQDNQSIKYIYQNEISTKTALACSPGTSFINPDGGMEKCAISEEKKNLTTKNITIINNELHEKVFSIIKNTPMEKMALDISERDRPVAALLVAIAMKESKFGKYAPKKNGADCFNYWGYRGRENPTLSGYSCFESSSQAIKIVGDRIETMVNRGARTPADMISWKCGSTCAGHDPVSVRKWIADVAIHYYQINSTEELAKK